MLENFCIFLFLVDLFIQVLYLFELLFIVGLVSGKVEIFCLLNDDDEEDESGCWISISSGCGMIKSIWSICCYKGSCWYFVYSYDGLGQFFFFLVS